MRRVGVLAGAVAVAVAALLLTGGARYDPGARLPKDVIPIDVGDTVAGNRIPPGFVGISTEFSSLTAYAGRDPGAINPLFVGLVRNLAPGSTPIIRFGGDTTDWTWWPTPGASRPPWARYVLTPLWIQIARSLALAAHARLIVGINFEADSRVLAGAEARALLDGLGRAVISAFELGNEPEVYGQIGWYENAAGAPVLGRAPSYGFRSYLPDYRTISSALPQRVPLAGPALALTWPLTVAGRFLQASPRVRIFTFHFYPLKRCFNARSSPTYPTLGHLMAPQSAEPAAGLTAAVSAAHARGVSVRVDEFNSVSCRGLPGLSNTFASALWVVDSLFRLAQAGVDGVNIHTLPHVSYEPFAFTRSGGRWTATVAPIYYGLLLFGRAAPPGSRLLAIAHPPTGSLRSWATRGADGTVRVVLVNDSGGGELKLAVRTPRAGSAATLERLTAPGLTATSGVTLAGQSYGAATTTSSLAGRATGSILDPVSGRYLITLPPASAALVTVRPR